MTRRPTPEPSDRVTRRGFIGAAVAGSAGAVAAVTVLTTNPAAADGGVPVTPPAAYPFEGKHQSGILELAQRASAFVAFTVTSPDRARLQQMLKTLTSTIRYLMTGRGVPYDGMVSTSYENGVLGPDIAPDGLTVTVSVGSSLFDERFGLKSAKPARLRPMDEFPNDVLDRSFCDGDLILQICANNHDTVLHALRILMRATRADLQVRWRKEGFTSPPRPAGTPRNLLGFKDGTANKEVLDSPEVIDQIVWTKGGGDEPAWVEGGSYHVVRLIRMFVEFWDRVSVLEQQRMIGRDRDSGTPLTGSKEFDLPDYRHDPYGDVVPVTAHIRLANPHDGTVDDQRLLRRSFNYSAGTDPNGQLDMGLIFACFNQDLDRQFVTVQKRLIDEPLVDYISPFGGGYFFALPGARDDNDWLGRGMLSSYG
ncbi:iron uptake transporter deferrochelatase/peroxidase subunit [Actinopolymorpha pittospori]|uniref:Deferrochelatase n=1 Tax=Actinopolymorpha pittospori TaxID=648752 RepID=A0A927MSI2_9ACTN|nr:iron uptake transporter deferrochelatase/peroxidase subunit [Actinopolymorpha pittospori]MBE1604063.1 deferrochelatase/peroxidase EfeB [Actinopolymorpha pittospori]